MVQDQTTKTLTLALSTYFIYVFDFKSVTGVVVNNQHSSFDELEDFVLTLGRYEKQPV
jgi:hypothetical protein